MKEPVATVTNAAYLVAGIALLAHGGAWTNVIYALSLVWLAVASGGFHATRTRIWQTLDETAMYAALCALLAVLGVPWFVAYAAAAVLIVLWERISSFTAVPILVAACLIVFAIGSPAKALGLGIIATASYAARAFGEHVGGRPGDALHGLWHVGTAVALYLAA